MTVNLNLKLLKKLRNDAKYSLSDLSNLLHYKTPTGYWLIEKGQRSINVDVLYKLAKLYSCKMEDLLIVTE